MRHDPGGLAQGAYAGGMVSPAAAVGGEGFIILPDGRNEIPTDAGFHYGDVQYGDGLAGALTPVNQSSEEKIHGMFIRSSLVRPSAPPEVRAVELGLSESIRGASGALVTLRAEGAFFQALEAFWDADCQTPVAWYQEVYWVDWWIGTATPPATIFLRGSSSVSDVRGATLELAYKPATSTTEIQLATLPITVYAVGINYPGGIDDTEREVNWDDDGPANSKSDRRDTGIPNGSTKESNIGCDGDVATAVLNLWPSALADLFPSKTVSFTVTGQTDKGAIWDEPNRGGIAKSSYQLSDLPKTVTFEAVYPHELSATGETTGSVDAEIVLNLSTSASQDTMKVRQYLEANNTYYTLPHEAEYEVRYGTDRVNLNCRIYNEASGSVACTVIEQFAEDTEVQGTGLMITPAFYGGKWYPYLKYGVPQGSTQAQWCVNDNAITSASKLLTDLSTAKYVVGGNLGYSAVDKPSDITIPTLHERIVGANERFEWITAIIAEQRKVDDTGPGGGNFDMPAKWMDIFVPYVAPEGRGDGFEEMTMVQLLGGDGYTGTDPQYIITTFGDLRVKWTETQ